MAKSKVSKDALAVGRSMAERTLKRRRKAARTRQQALAARPKVVTRTMIIAGAKGAGAKAQVVAGSAGVVIAEGDSWFDYPFHDVLNELEDSHGFEVESVAHKGDTVEAMAYSEGQLDSFARRVEKVLRSDNRPKAILLSGGGNDVAGDEFAILLNHATSTIAGLNESIVTGVIDERTRDAYITILGAITALSNKLIGASVPIIVHGYDYVVPDGRGFFSGLGPLPGPWLEPGFRRKGYQAMTRRKEIIVELIDRLNAMLKGLANDPAFPHVRYLDLRETLSTGPNYKDWWANELHPTPEGFKVVAAKFAALIDHL